MDPTRPLAGIERKREPRDETKAIAYDTLDELWSRPRIGLREKTPWRMLYETAARANEILALNIEDLDLDRKQAAVTAKGGHREVVIWASGTARLLPRYLDRRRRGPVFVTTRQPNVVPADRDRCPDTGLGRLSYQTAWKLFNEASGGHAAADASRSTSASTRPASIRRLPAAQWGAALRRQPGHGHHR